MNAGGNKAGDSKAGDSKAGDKPQTPQSESIPGPTYEHPQGMNDPVTDEEAGAPTGNPPTGDK